MRVRLNRRTDLEMCRGVLRFSGGSAVKNLSAMQETQVRFLGRKDPLEEGMATHCSAPAWRIPWTQEPGGLKSTGSHRGGHD